MNKIYLFLFLSMFLFSFASAALIVTSDNSSVNVRANEETLINFYFKNSFNYSIYNISLTPLANINMSIINQIAPNETKVQSIKIKTTNQFYIVSSLQFYFYFKVNISASTVNETISFLTYGFSPQYSEIVQNSRFRIYNNDNSYINRHFKIYDPDNIEIYSALLPYQEYINYLTFSKLGYYRIYSMSPSYEALVKVVSPLTEVLARDPDLNINFNLNINSTYRVSSYSYTISPTSFNLSYNEQGESALIISNTGVENIYNLNFNCDWCVFNKNNLTLAPGATTVITAYITPQVYSTVETNKSYNKILYINSENGGKYNYTFNVFVKYSEINFSSGASSDIKWWVENKSLCIKVFNITQCISEPEIVYIANSTYCQRSVNVSYTEEDILRWFTLLSELDAKYGDNTEEVLKYLDKLIADSVANTINLNNVTSQVDIQNKRADNQSIFIFFLISLIVMIALIGIMIFIILKFKKTKISLSEMG